MELQTTLIDLESIETIATERLRFDPAERQTEIEHLARAIVSLQGLLRIPVVEEVEIDTYRLIAGHFDYYAYLEARKLEGKLPDRIRVFVVNPKKATAEPILQQLDALDRLEAVSGSSGRSDSGEGSIEKLELELQNVKSEVQALNKGVSEAVQQILKTEIGQMIEQAIQGLKNDLNSKFESLSLPSEPGAIGTVSIDLNDPKIQEFTQRSLWDLLSTATKDSAEYQYIIAVFETKGFLNLKPALTSLLNNLANNKAKSSIETIESLDDLRKASGQTISPSSKLYKAINSWDVSVVAIGKLFNTLETEVS